MAWTITDWTPGNIQQYADEFWRALKERQAAGGGSSISVFPASGANIQTGTSAAPTTTTGKFGWRYLQDQIASICTSFVRSHNDSGVALATDYYDGEATIEMWTFANLMKAVRGGTAQSDFRRATSYPTDWTNWADANYSTGKVALGTPRDIFGPWIPADIQKALNMLVWTKPGASWSMQISGDNWDEEGGELAPTWADAKAYPENDWGVFNVDRQATASPRAQNRGDYYSATTKWRAWLYRVFNYGYCTSWDGCKKTADYYAKPTQYRDAFTSFGDFSPEATADVFNKWHSRTFNAGTSVCPTSTALGQIAAMPTPWCDAPDAGDPDRGKGYTLTDQAVIVRWNITDGFAYV